MFGGSHSRAGSILRSGLCHWRQQVRNKGKLTRVVQCMTTLFDSLEIGRLTLPNRVTMAPLTRSRAGRDGVPTDLHETYYSQRASMGLIVTEGVFPAVTSRAFPGQPGIETAEQISGWRRVADSVHEAGGRIFMQVMNGGRLSHASRQGLSRWHPLHGIGHGGQGFRIHECPVPRPRHRGATARRR